MSFDLRCLRTDGISIAGAMPADKVAEIVAHLQCCQIYDSHVPAKASQCGHYHHAVANWPVFSVKMLDVMMAPHWFEFALTFLPMAKEYFGEDARLYSLNAFWTCPTQNAYPHTQEWHRDRDDKKQFAIFMFGTDVERPEDGQHLYQRGTHTDRTAFGAVECVTGLAGTVFIEDPWGLHMAAIPQTKPRLLLWARYGVSIPPEAYKWDGLKPIDKQMLGSRYPADLETQSAIRMVAA